MSKKQSRHVLVSRLAAEQVIRLRQLGRQMSNLCFNLSQYSVIPEQYRMQMRDAYARWDETDKPIIDAAPPVKNEKRKARSR